MVGTNHVPTGLHSIIRRARKLCDTERRISMTLDEYALCLHDLTLDRTD
jgi:hypothetical protein